MAQHSIQVLSKKKYPDPRAKRIKSILLENGIKISDVTYISKYSIESEALSPDDLEKLAENLFRDKITETAFVDEPVISESKPDWAIEVVLKQGAKDNAGEVSEDAIEAAVTGAESYVSTSNVYLVSGKATEAKLTDVSRWFLSNPVVEKFRVMDYETYLKKGHEPRIQKVMSTHVPKTEHISLDISEEELFGISKKRSLALNLREMSAIKEYYMNPDVIEARRLVGLDEMPTDVELEVLGQSWSEHCKHKIFNSKIKYSDGRIVDSIFKSYIRQSTEAIKAKKDFIVSTLWDNSGVIKFVPGWLFCFKNETHNSPSNKYPFGGAETGIVGVYRDPMGTGQGGRLIFGNWGFCTGSPFYNGPLVPEIHPKQMLEGIRAGVEAGGNRSGVPTIWGKTFFDDGFIGKPGVYVGAGGIIPEEVNGKNGWEKNADAGDLVVMVGGRIGKDGIHGATESSMEAGNWISAQHVQIGDPLTQKKMHDMLLEARDLGLYKCTTDNGAGGLSSSVGEMASFSGGCEIDLAKAPLKYHGLDPWEILISESQERMTLAVDPEKIEELKALALKHDVEISVLGNFTGTGKFHVMYEDQTVAYLDLELMDKGVPQMEIEAEWNPTTFVEPESISVSNHNETLKEMLARSNISSKEYITRQFDHEVQGTSAIKQYAGIDNDVESDAAVIVPIEGRDEALAVSSSMNPKISQIDTYDMTAYVIDEAIRRIIGGTQHPAI